MNSQEFAEAKPILTIPQARAIAAELPDMTAVKTVKLSSLGLPTKHNIEVPTFECSFTHPDVPAIDDDYQFLEELVDMLA